MYTLNSGLIIPEVSEEIYKRHTKSSLKQARKLQREFDISHYNDRRLCTGITIDSLHSPDLDDGIHLEKISSGWLLYISIASPTELLEPGSAIEQEGLDRSTSVYFGETHMYHMLPNIIATDLASLNHHTQRLSLTLELELDNDFEVVRTDLYKSLFFNRRRHSPESFLRGISHTSDSEYEYFALMHEFARGLRKKRENTDRITEFDESDRRIMLGEIVLGHNNSHISSFVIQEFMLLANMEVAKFMVREQVAGVFRQHMPEYKGVSKLPKVLDRAFYSEKPGYHKGLGIEPYMHFTSPIRRIADYISHRQLICLLGGQQEHYTHEEIEKLCRYINLQLTSIVMLQREDSINDHGKRLIRKGKRLGTQKGIRAHIQSRRQRNFRIPSVIVEDIVREIEETGEVPEWVLKTFLVSEEKDIITAMKKAVLKDVKVRKYVSLFNNLDEINIEEEIVQKQGILYYRVFGSVLGCKIEIAIKIQKAQSRSKYKEICINNKEYTIAIDSERRAKVQALSEVKRQVFDIALASRL